MKLHIPQKYIDAFKSILHPEVLFEFGETHYRIYTTNRAVALIAELPFTKQDEIDDIEVDRVVIPFEQLKSVTTFDKTIEDSELVGLPYQMLVKKIDCKPIDGFPYVLPDAVNTIAKVCNALQVEDSCRWFAYGSKRPFVVDLAPNIKLLGMGAKDHTPDTEGDDGIKDFLRKDITEW